MKKKFMLWLGGKLATMVRVAELERETRELGVFANKPVNLRVQSPSRIINAGFITIGDNVSLGPGCMLNAIRRYPGRFLSDVPAEVEVVNYQPSIKIGDRVSATGYLTISAVKSVVIEDDVIIASSVFIGDNSHGRSRVDIAFKYQPLEDIAPIRICRGCWIAEHAVIMPGVTIGEYSIIGANSVVSTDIPPRSIAVGAPAKVVKTWSESESGWVNSRP